MAGIYLHIPFCKQACHYCDFHFSTSLSMRTDLLNSMQLELFRQKEYLDNEKIETIYFGGGTPSLLETAEIHALLESIHKHYKVSEQAEITLEANPDDLDARTLKDYFSMGINRLSIGVQSFFDDDLKRINRAHSSAQAKTSVGLAKEAGFHNITLDLIFGLPDMSMEKWEKNIQAFLSADVPHISAYALTVEPRTALSHYIKKGSWQLPPEEYTIAQYNLLRKILAGIGYEHYEVSNFAKPGFYSQHNSAYWLQKKYLGIGPSAHSYNGSSRQWNIAHNIKYTQHLNKGEPWFETEILDEKTLLNEYLLTRLRTSWGVEKQFLEKNYPAFYPAITLEAEKQVRKKVLLETETHYIISQEGMLLADSIAADMFVL